MQKIWDELSKPLPPGVDAAKAPPVMTAEERTQLIETLDQCEYQYVAEGRANVVYGITGPTTTTGAKVSFENTLLRVPKATRGVTPCDYQTLQDFHENQVEVKVGRQHIVPQVLVKISAKIAQTLHDKRGKDDGSVIEEGYAMLIQDMGASLDQRSLEFKPKWLVQSPLAPEDAIRCRTCAREAYRNSLKEKEGKKTSAPPCPLGLMYEDRAVVMSIMDQIAPELPEEDRERLADALKDSGILERLRDLQVKGDPKSENRLFEKPWDDDFGLTMTLRDCSCFVAIPSDKAKPIVIKLADVDKKNWEEKQTYWQKSHTRLVDERWYMSPNIDTACVFQYETALKEGKEIPKPFRKRLGKF
ncbi:inositol-pentakisphosphate 2-kinase-domain-containing protein [Xylariaceae sp. FL0016]|nr:inositol-pentakisphosphate 2-kinase-domain-containing protein [Xylariaceae sp. FL0016]